MKIRNFALDTLALFLSREAYSDMVDSAIKHQTVHLRRTAVIKNIVCPLSLHSTEGLKRVCIANLTYVFCIDKTFHYCHLTKYSSIPAYSKYDLFR